MKPSKTVTLGSLLLRIPRVYEATQLIIGKSSFCSQPAKKNVNQTGGYFSIPIFFLSLCLNNRGSFVNYIEFRFDLKSWSLLIKLVPRYRFHH